MTAYFQVSQHPTQDPEFETLVIQYGRYEDLMADRRADGSVYQLFECGQEALSNFKARADDLSMPESEALGEFYAEALKAGEPPRIMPGLSVELDLG